MCVIYIYTKKMLRNFFNLDQSWNIYGCMNIYIYIYIYIYIWESYNLVCKYNIIPLIILSEE